MHPRQKIRDAIYDILEPHRLLKNLFNARGRTISELKAPCANITLGNEVYDDDIAGFAVKRKLVVYIKAYVVAGKEAANQLDEISYVIENLLHNKKDLNGNCDVLEYQGMQPNYDNAPLQDSAMITLQYNCNYTWEPDETNLNDLNIVHVDIDMSSPRNDPQKPYEPDGQIDASATIDLTE